MHLSSGLSSRVYHFRNGPDEEKRIRVLKSKTKCKNEKAKKDGYYIGKTPLKSTDQHNFRFEARLDWDDESPVLSYLNTDRGECMLVRTDAKSQHCGIAKALMILCLGDEDITEDGGLNPSTYHMEKPYGDAIWKDMDFSTFAREFCKTIVAIPCDPILSTTTNYACKAYIEAAKSEGYQMMFVDKPADEVEPDDHYHVLKTKDAELEFKKNPDDFLKSKGNEWFFCKCNRGTTKECYELDSYAKWNQPKTGT